MEDVNDNLSRLVLECVCVQEGFSFDVLVHIHYLYQELK